MIGAGGFEHQDQDNLKLKLAFDLPRLRLTYRGRPVPQRHRRHAQTYLPDCGGAAVMPALNIDGRA